MQLIYQGTDITDSVEILSAIHKDASGGRCDGLNLTLYNAGAWYRWKPQTDDTIEVIHDGYSTGTLYVNTIAPDGNLFRILATSLKNSAFMKKWASYENKTLGEIMNICAAECGMESRIFGLDPNIRYDYMIRRNESCAAFLDRLMQWEGAVLKTYSGRFTAISVSSAQDLTANAILRLNPESDAFEYIRRDEKKLSSIEVLTPYMTASARDTGVRVERALRISCLPARNSVTAGRWARGMLLTTNRKAEELTIESEFNAVFTAMARLDIEGGTDADGEWILDEAEHDFVSGTSRATLRRCIRTVV